VWGGGWISFFKCHLRMSGLFGLFLISCCIHAVGTVCIVSSLCGVLRTLIGMILLPFLCFSPRFPVGFESSLLKTCDYVEASSSRRRFQIGGRDVRLWRVNPGTDEGLSETSPKGRRYGEIRVSFLGSMGGERAVRGFGIQSLDDFWMRRLESVRS